MATQWIPHVSMTEKKHFSSYNREHLTYDLDLQTVSTQVNIYELKIIKLRNSYCLDTQTDARMTDCSTRTTKVVGKMQLKNR